MPFHKLSERTMTMLPTLIAKAGITNPIVGAEETKTAVRFYVLGAPKPVTVRKHKPTVRAQPKPAAIRQTRGKKKAT